VDNPNRPHSYLFFGPSGSGKTTLARIFAQELGSSGSDLTEIDVGDYRGIDSIREIRQSMGMTPMVSASRIWILDECHKLTGDAQSALLKALEDTPPRTYFMLATTDPKKLLPTIINRCTPCQVCLLNEGEMKKVILRAARTVKGHVTDEAMEALVDVAQGTPRTALVALEKYLSNPLAPIQAVTEDSPQLVELCRALLKKQSWKTTSKLLGALKGTDPEDLRRAILGYAAAVLMKGSDDGQALAILDIFREPFYNSGWPGVVWACCLSVQKVG